jgi:cytochrome c oxidase assembly factor CtaG
MGFCDLTISFVLASFIYWWVCLDVSNLSSQGELECECEIEMFLAQMKFLMGHNL